MHLDHLSVDPVRFRAIRNYTDQLLEGVEQVSVNKIFRDRRITCNRLGITTPVMLYSLLQVYCSDRYELPSTPWFPDLTLPEKSGLCPNCKLCAGGKFLATQMTFLHIL